jgi:ribosomal protein L11 methyltransferase
MAAEARYPYVAVDVEEADADEAGACLFELGAAGVEQRDASTLVRGAGERVTIAASFESRGDAETALEQLPAAWRPRIEEIVGDAWRDEWKKYFEPFRICRGVVVCPPWRATPSANETLGRTPEGSGRYETLGRTPEGSGRYETLGRTPEGSGRYETLGRTPEGSGRYETIILEPGRAFGTGLHETTRLVAEVLADRARWVAGAQVLDVGCGSGILSLVALKLGAARVRAIDVDPDAVAVTRENAQRNGAIDRLAADETPLAAVAETFRLVVANIEHRTLLELTAPLASRVAPGGLLVLSGLLAPEVAPPQLADVREHYAAEGLIEEETRRQGEWIAVVFRRRVDPGRGAGS